MVKVEKGRIWWGLLLLHLFAFTSIDLHAASVDVSAPEQVAVGERFRVVFSVDARPSDFQPPSFTGLRVLSGPSQSSSSSTQIINNQVTTTFSVSYTYILEAIEEGRFTIGSARFVVDGSDYGSDPHEIVVSGQAPAGSQPQSGQPQQQPATQQQPSPQDIFIRAQVSNTSPYQSEQVIVTYKLYTRVAVSRYNVDRLPSFQGFWSENLTSSTQPQPEVEVVDGQQYNSVELRRVALFPQRSGELRIEPLEVESTIRMRSQRQSRSIFDDFFGGFQEVPYTIRSNAVVLQVKPLPAQNRPASFKGLAGSFNLSASLSPSTLQVNDAANLVITINGSGNLRMAEKPEIQFPPNLEVFDPNVSDQIRNERSGVQGSRTFDYTVIPRTGGEFEVPAIQLTYFDPSTAQYITREAGPFTIQVGGIGSGTGDGPETVYRSDIQSLSTDIRFINTQPDQLFPIGRLFFKSRKFFLFLTLPFVLFGIVLIIGRREIRLRGDQALMRNRKAEKLARKRLRTAAGYLHTNEDQLFYDEIFRALWGYISDKLSIPVSRLNKEEISRLFESRSVAEELATKFLSALNACEFARFAPGSDGDKKEEVYQQAMDAIIQMEKEFKHKRHAVT